MKNLINLKLQIVGYMFNFNPDNGRYVLAKGFEYVLGEDSVSVGSCAKSE